MRPILHCQYRQSYTVKGYIVSKPQSYLSSIASKGIIALGRSYLAVQTANKGDVICKVGDLSPTQLAAFQRAAGVPRSQWGHIAEKARDLAKGVRESDEFMHCRDAAVSMDNVDLGRAYKVFKDALKVIDAAGRVA